MTLLRKSLHFAVILITAFIGTFVFGIIFCWLVFRQ